MTRSPSRPGANGAALLISLLLLAALTLIGLAAATDAGLQQRMAANSESARESRRRAELALAWAQDWLFSVAGAEPPGSCLPPCETGAVIRAVAEHTPAPEYLTDSWWVENGYLAGVDPADGRIADQLLAATNGRWLVEELHRSDTMTADDQPVILGWYRLTARGADPGGTAVTVVESIFARPWGDAGWTDGLPPERSDQHLCRRLTLGLPCGRLAWRRLR